MSDWTSKKRICVGAICIFIATYIINIFVGAANGMDMTSILTYVNLFIGVVLGLGIVGLTCYGAYLIIRGIAEYGDEEIC